MFRRLFLDHPRSVNESYWAHMGMAGSFGWALAKASCACFLHALVPGLCERTGSSSIRELHARMVSNRVVQAPRDSGTGDAEALLWMAVNI